jgi:hypothetical protein
MELWITLFELYYKSINRLYVVCIAWFCFTEMPFRLLTVDCCSVVVFKILLNSTYSSPVLVSSSYKSAAFSQNSLSDICYEERRI